jgi:hypothetical protein
VTLVHARFVSIYEFSMHAGESMPVQVYGFSQDRMISYSCVKFIALLMALGVLPLLPKQFARDACPIGQIRNPVLQDLFALVG